MTRSRLIARWLAGASTLLFTWYQFVPWGPVTTDENLEDSWIQVQHLAFLQHWQFGRDIVFTFGPWGFLFYGRYSPATYPVTLIAWLVLSVVFWLAARRIARTVFENEFASWCWIMAFTGIVHEGVAWVLLLLLAHFFVEERPFTMIQAWLVIALSLLSLTQFIVFVLALMSVTAIGLDNILRQRRFPWILPVFGAGLICFWAMAGQHLSNLGSYLRYSWQITNGFTEAMMLTGSNEIQDICCFWVAAIVVMAMIGYAAYRRVRFSGIIPCLGVCFVLFTAFKYGYVRHDGHDLWAVKDLLLVSLASVAAVWPLVRKKGQWMVVASLSPTAAVVLFLSFTYSHDAEAGLLAGIPKTSGIRGFLTPLELMSGKNPLRDAYEAHLARLREQFPLPQIDGTVDAYTWNLDPIFAHDLSYHPRPVIQSYSTYTPELVWLNAEFLRSENAPENILIEGSSSNPHFPPKDEGLTIDDRFPSLDDGLSWPELLTRYDIRETEVSFVLLKKLSEPRQFHLAPLTDTLVNFGDRIALPSATNGPIWAEIEIDPTWWGRVVSALYKPPILLLEASMRGEKQPLAKRLVPGMARSGFLLSPLVEGCPSFALLASTDASSGLADDELTTFRITTADGSSAASYYREPVRLRLYRLEYPKQNLEDVKGFRRLTRLEMVLRHAQLLYGNYPPRMVYDPGEGTVLEVPSESGIWFPVLPDARHLKVGFGIHGPEKSEPLGAEKIVFQAVGVNQQGQKRLLWSRPLDPDAQKSGPGKQEIRVDLGGLNLSGIVLQTAPVVKNHQPHLQAYWSEIDFE